MGFTRWIEPAHWAGFVLGGRPGKFAGLSQFLVAGETQGPSAAFGYALTLLGMTGVGRESCNRARSRRRFGTLCAHANP